jgi:steroid delta-isomerase-like uncharacterized protein
MQGVDPAAVVGRYIDECWNRCRLDLVHELVSEDFVDHFPFDPDLPAGRDGLIATIRLLRSAFSGLRLSIEDMILEDDRVAVRFELRGTHSGTFAGRPPSGQPVQVQGTVIHRVHDHQIIDQWCLFDAIGLLRQIETPPSAAFSENDVQRAQFTVHSSS